MKLDKMRGLGPWFAFATPICFFLAVLGMGALVSGLTFDANHHAVFPWWWDAGLAAWLILVALTVVSALLVAIDLEWIEHPVTHTGLTYVALGAMTVATLAFLVILIEAVMVVDNWTVPLTGFVFLAGVGVYLVLINWVGWRARLLGTTLAWLGFVSGAAFLATAVSVYVTPVSFFGLALFPAVVLYLGWSLWLAFRLQAPAPAAS